MGTQNLLVVDMDSVYILDKQKSFSEGALNNICTGKFLIKVTIYSELQSTASSFFIDCKAHLLHIYRVFCSASYGASSANRVPM